MSIVGSLPSRVHLYRQVDRLYDGSGDRCVDEQTTFIPAPSSMCTKHIIGSGEESNVPLWGLLGLTPPRMLINISRVHDRTLYSRGADGQVAVCSFIIFTHDVNIMPLLRILLTMTTESTAASFIGSIARTLQFTIPFTPLSGSLTRAPRSLVLPLWFQQMLLLLVPASISYLDSTCHTISSAMSITSLTMSYSSPARLRPACIHSAVPVAINSLIRPVAAFGKTSSDAGALMWGQSVTNMPSVTGILVSPLELGIGTDTQSASPVLVETVIGDDDSDDTVPIPSLVRCMNCPPAPLDSATVTGATVNCCLPDPPGCHADDRPDPIGEHVDNIGPLTCRRFPPYRRLGCASWGAGPCHIPQSAGGRPVSLLAHRPPHWGVVQASDGISDVPCRRLDVRWFRLKFDSKRCRMSRQYKYLKPRGFARYTRFFHPLGVTEAKSMLEFRRLHPICPLDSLPESLEERQVPA